MERPLLSSDERAAMITANLETVRALAGRFFRSWSRLRAVIDYEDLLQCGCIGLLDALEKFDPSRSVPFGVWARYRIRGAILDALEAASSGNAQVFSLEEMTPADPAIPSHAGAIEVRLTLEVLLETLSAREQELIEGLLEGDTLAAHAERLSLTPGRVSQIKSAAVRKLQQYRDGAECHKP